MMEGKNGDVIIDAVDLKDKTITVSSLQGGFYTAPEASGSSVLVNAKGQVTMGYMQIVSNPFYGPQSWANDFYLGYAAGAAYNYTPPTIEEKIEEKIQMGYQEVVPKWYVHQSAGDILHLCEQQEVQGYPPDLHQALVLNKNWHNHNVICSKCHQPAPSKVFFLSEAVK